MTPHFLGFRAVSNQVRFDKFFFRTQNEELDNVQFCRLVLAKNIVSREPTKTEI